MLWASLGPFMAQITGTVCREGGLLASAPHSTESRNYDLIGESPGPGGRNRAESGPGGKGLRLPRVTAQGGVAGPQHLQVGFQAELGSLGRDFLIVLGESGEVRQR